MIDDAELARRSILGFGEMIAVLGRWGVVEAEPAGPTPWVGESTLRPTTPGLTP